MNHLDHRKYACSSEDKLEVLSAQMSKTNAHMEDLSTTVKDLLQKWDRVMEHVVDALQNRVPEGSVPIKTHMLVVKGLITGFSVVVVVAVGAVKFAPLVVQALGN